VTDDPDPVNNVERGELLDELRQLNHALKRLQVQPLVKTRTARLLPVDNLRTVVKSTADQLSTVTRQIGGLL
jgi:hypothetical protein